MVQKHTAKRFIELEKGNFIQVRISEWNEETNEYDECQVCHDFASASDAYNFIIKYERFPNHVEDVAYPVIMERCGDDNHQEYVEELNTEDLLEQA